MKIIWTGEALDKLTEIEEFIAKDSPQRAERFINYLIKHTELISENPEIGRIVPEISNATIRELIIKEYRMVYKLQKNVILILSVFEGHRLLRRDELDIE